MKQAKASFAFSARSENEISFAVGDEIVILEENSSGWGKGRTNDYKEGYFPLAYVQVEELSDSDSDEAQADVQLSFVKGDKLTITKKGNDNDWWEGILERTKQKGLIPSNYVKQVDKQDTTKINQPASSSHHEKKPQANHFNEPAPPDGSQKQDEYKISESVEAKEHKRDERSSNYRVEESFESEPPISSSKPSGNPNQRQSGLNTSFTNISPLDASIPFELRTANYQRDLASLSPISPNISALAYDSAEIARRRHSMNISAASPLALSSLYAFSGEYTRDFDALCLLYPFVPSSVSQNPPAQVTPPKLPPISPQQPVFISPQADTPQQPISQPVRTPSSHQLQQTRPQSAPQITPRQSTSQPTSAPQPPPSAQPTLQTSSTPPKLPVVPKLALTSGSPERKEGYSNRGERERSSSAGASANAGANASASTQASSQTGMTTAPSSKTPGRMSSRYGAKSPGARRESSGGSLVSSTSKRKPKLEASLSMGKKHSMITHSYSAAEQPLDANQAHVPPQQNEIEYLKKILQQEVELRVHLESVVHDAHGKMNSASQYIKDLKAELFQAHMDISQLRVTNRQLNEQLDKYQLVTRVTVATQTERDENIDKIRLLTEQIHTLETNTDMLNEQIATLKSKTIDRSPRVVDRSPRNDKGGNEGNGVLNKSGGLVDYAAVKQQFARVRECLLLEKDIKDRLILEKAQAQEKLLKTEQNSKQIRRKLLNELQLKSDLNVRNQQIELQMQTLKEELANYKHLT